MIDPLHLRDDISLGAALAETLQPLIGPFSIGPALVIDGHGSEAGHFPIVCYTGSLTQNASVDAANVALVIDCYEDLTREAIAESYKRSQSVKSLIKPAQAMGAQNNTEMTMVIVVGRQSNLSLEQIAEEMRAHNHFTPSTLWPDAVAVLGKGLANYSAQVPGREQSGDFLLPCPSIAANSPAPSIDIELVIRPMGDRTINKVASFTLMRARIFDMNAGVADFNALLEGISGHGVSIKHYQFTTANQLVEVSKSREIQDRLSFKVFNITRGKDVLGSIQYRPWQDGTVLIAHGKFPIEMFLVFLQQTAPLLSIKSLQYFTSNDMQVSYVLPITEAQFHHALAVFESRTNMRVRPETSKFLIQQIGNEGTSTPFMARLMMGVMGLRDAVYEGTLERRTFDEYYDSVLSNLRSAREASKEIKKLLNDHSAKVASGDIVSEQGRGVHIRESIDRQLKREIESFVNSAARATKNGLQTLTSKLGLDIGFLFKKDSTFRAGITNLRNTDSDLAEYLLAARNWMEPLMLTRNDLEHTSGSAVRVSYVIDNVPIRAVEPVFGGLPISEYVAATLDRVSCFVEEMITHCLRNRLPPGLTLSEIPLSERDPNAPERFRLTVSPGGLTPWRLVATNGQFDQT